MSEHRSCGPCTACCEGWLSSTIIDMSIGHPCRHCTPAGCGIYARRPRKPCRTFECGWLRRDSPLPLELRPDRCGAIVLLGRKFQDWDVIMATPTGWVIPAETLESLMLVSRQQSLPLVWIENLHDNGVYTHFKRSAFGPAAFVRAITSNANPLDIRSISS